MKEPPCINPDDVEVGDLMAYLHGEAPRRVTEHVARCTHCARQVERLRVVDARLLDAFYRLACPTAEALTDFALGNLPPVERLRVAAHVRDCVQCSEEVAAARKWGREEPASLLERLQEALTLALIAQPVAQVAAPARGRGWQGRFEIDNLVITLSLRDDHLTGRARRRCAADADLSGQAWLILEEVAKEVLFKSLIDPQGRFRIKVSEPGIYALLLRIDGQDVTVERIQIV
mgnify:CR=1 FL=1